MPTKRVLLAVCGLAVVVTLAHALPAEARVDTKGGRTRLVGLTTKTPAECCTPEPACCPDPCIVYRHCGPKLCCGCEPPTEITLKVKDPCTGCEVDVPICLPACCKGEPVVCCGKGLFCRDVVDYEWCCGFRVKVVFRHCGDLLVKTWGY